MATEAENIDVAIADVDSFAAYAHLAQRTAVFPEGQTIGYLGLGITDELSEVWGKIEAITNMAEIPDDLSEIGDEIGDVYWYLANLALHFGVDNEIDFAPKNMDPANNLDHHYADWALDTMEISLVNSGALSGFLKKTIRGDKGDKTDSVAAGIQSLLNALEEVISVLGLGTPKGVAQANLRKLFDRQERGVLKGDGDNR